MVTTIIDLEQIKFEDSEAPLFEGKELELSSKNFILQETDRVNQH